MRKWWYIAMSVLLLAPVYWQPRVQAGDLSSHIYNSWLAQLIENGRTQGLVIVSQIVSEHGGTVEVRSELGKSTSFRLTFAALPNEIAEVEEHEAEVELSL